MQVQNTPSKPAVSTAQEIKPAEVEVNFGDRIKAFFSGWFSKAPSPDSTKQISAAKLELPAIKKASAFEEVSLTISNVQEAMRVMKPEVKPVPKPDAKTTPKPEIPKKPPANYKAVNPIVLKDFPNFKINIVHGDLFESDADVIVNAANVGLKGGGGIDGAIHAAGGAIYADKHRALKIEKPDFKEGDALIIEKVELKSGRRDKETRKPIKDDFFKVSKDVIVVAGPNRQGYTNKKGILDHNKELYNCYYNALELAHNKGKSSIAFPAISIGIFKYPKDEAAKMSLKAISDFAKKYPDTTLKSISIHCFDPTDLDYAKELADWKFYQDQIRENENFDPIASGTTRPVVVKPLTDAEINKIRADEKKSVKLALENLSVELSLKLSGKANVGPIGHENFGATCYMNASLQSLNSAYRHKKPLQELIAKPLTLNADDTFQTLENRLSLWAPIQKVNYTLAQLLDGKKTLEDKIKSENDLNKLLVFHNQLGQINEAIDTDKDLSLMEDRILFKWSFLLYMQACKYGIKTDVEKALSAHHRVCFAIAKHTEFMSLPGKKTFQEMGDPSCHMDLFNAMLPLGINTSSYKQYVKDGKVMIASHQTSMGGVINLKLQPGQTFMDGFAKAFEYVDNNSENQTFEDPITSEKYVIQGDQIKDCITLFGSPSQVITLNVNVNKGQSSLVYDKDKDKNCYQEDLKLGSYFHDKNTEADYKITGLSVWSSDHYYSYVRYLKADNKVQWYKCNDSIVEEVSEKDVPFDRASTLTYAKVGNASTSTSGKNEV